MKRNKSTASIAIEQVMGAINIEEAMKNRNSQAIKNILSKHLGRNGSALINHFHCSLKDREQNDVIGVEKAFLETAQQAGNSCSPVSTNAHSSLLLNLDRFISTSECDKANLADS